EPPCPGVPPRPLGHGPRVRVGGDDDRCPPSGARDGGANGSIAPPPPRGPAIPPGLRHVSPPRALPVRRSGARRSHPTGVRRADGDDPTARAGPGRERPPGRP